VKNVKWMIVLFLAYVGIVCLFESLLGYFQPAGQATLVITTATEDGSLNDRVLGLLESNGQLYVAANHWPRAWYTNAIANPAVQVTVNGTKTPYHAVPVSGTEHDRVDRAHRLGLVFRILTGFPPRYLVRLDPS
jgi:hypothetical protein